MVNSTKRKLMTLMAVYNWASDHDEKYLATTEFEAIADMQAKEFGGATYEEFYQLSEDEQEKVKEEFAANMSETAKTIISELAIELLAEEGSND
ncbi:hypothetical protein ACIU4M_00615 [Bacillus altitudinis]|uniref:hypothetical protein n=1 Tax=Bacillus altitudinis TaxID=293387 RepID=UPI00389AFF16